MSNQRTIGKILECSETVKVIRNNEILFLNIGDILYEDDIVQALDEKLTIIKENGDTFSLYSTKEIVLDDSFLNQENTTLSNLDDSNKEEKMTPHSEGLEVNSTIQRSAQEFIATADLSGEMASASFIPKVTLVQNTAALTPTVDIYTIPKSSVHLILNGQNLSPVVVGSNGHTTVTLPQGSLTSNISNVAIATVTTPDGHQSKPIKTHIIVDTHIDQTQIDITDNGNMDNVINAKEASNVKITGSIDPTAKLDKLEIIDTAGNKLLIDPKSVHVDTQGNFVVSGIDVSKLKDGSLSIIAHAIDPIGNQSANTDTILLDVHTTTPLAPIITIPPLGNNLTPTLGLSGTPGSTVHTIINGHSLAPVVIGSNGHATLTVPAGVLTSNIANSITATAMGQYGNVSPVTNSTIIVDTTPPTISINPIDIDNVINANEHKHDLIISGKTNAENGQQVTLNIAGVEYHTLVHNGTFHLTLPATTVSSFKDGEHIQVSANVTDRAGNIATPATSIIDIDTKTTAYAALHDGNLGDHDDILNAAEAKSAVVLGKVEAGSVIESAVITDAKGNTIPISVHLKANGTFHVISDLSKLSDGRLTLELKGHDKAGNLFHETAYMDKDTSVDATISLEPITADNVLNAAEIQSTISVQGRVGGSAHDGDSITLLVNSIPYTGIVSKGKFSIDVPGSELAKTNTLSAHIMTMDGAGNVVSANATAAYTLDTKALASITIDTITPDNVINANEANGKVNITGSIAGDIKDGYRVIVHVNAKEYIGTVQGSHYSIAVDGSDLKADNKVTATVTGVDTAGNTKTVTLDHNYNVDTAVTQISANLTDATDSGISDKDNITNIVRPTIDGYTEADAKIVIKDNNGMVVATTVANKSGYYKAVLNQNLTDGDHKLSITATDKAGNTIVTTQDLTIDTKVNAYIGLHDGNLNDHDDVLNAQEETKAVTLGKVEPGSTIYSLVITDSQGKMLSISPAEYHLKDNGTFFTTLDLSTLADGELSISLKGEDKAGNLFSATDTMLKDTHIDQTSVDITDNANVDNVINKVESTNAKIVGTIDPSAKLDHLEIVDTAGNKIHIDPKTVNVDAQGNFDISGVDVSQLKDGKLTVVAHATDPAGNTSKTFDTITLDIHTSTPVTPVITVPQHINTLTPTINITGTPDSVVHAIINGHQIPPVTIGANGHVQVTLPFGVITPNIPNSITATAVSSHGNVSNPTHSSITVDTIAPNISIDAIDTDNIINAKELKQDLLIHGKTDAENGQQVTLQVDGKDYHTSVHNGVFSIIVPHTVVAAFQDGHTIEVVATVSDKAGNSAIPTKTDISIDTSANISIDAISRDDMINAKEHNEDLLIRGTVAKVEDGQRVDVNFHGHHYQATVHGSKWSINVPAADVRSTPDGIMDIKAEVQDKAGNFAQTSHQIEVDIVVKAHADHATAYEDQKSDTKGNVLDNDDKDGTEVLSKDIIGKYGIYHFKSDGGFTYTLDSSKSEVQQLAQGDKLTDSVNYEIQDKAGNTTSTTLTTHIVGTNDRPVITLATPDVTEDKVVSSTVSLGITDVDKGEAHFQGETNIQGKYGYAEVTSDGKLTYYLDNTKVQYLRNGELLHDTITVKAADGETKDVSIDIHGTQDKATITTAVLHIDEVSKDFDRVQINVRDADHNEAFLQGGIIHTKYGVATVSSDGEINYKLNHGSFTNKQIGDVKDTITVTSFDGKTTQNIDVDIHFKDDKATILGTSVGSVVEQGTTVSGIDHASGGFLVADPDSSTDMKAATLHGKYGDLIIDKQGSWHYTLDNTKADHLAQGQKESEVFTVHSADGTAKDITINITGSNDKAIIQSATLDTTEDTKYKTINLTIKDVDTGEANFQGGIIHGQHGFATLSINGHLTYHADTKNLQNLAEGEHLKDVITVLSKDGTSHVVDIDIVGTNDKPTMSAVSKSVIEGGAELKGSIVAHDIDHNAVLEYTTINPPAGFTLTKDGNYTFDPKNSAYDHIEAGKIDVVKIPVIVTDEYGASVTKELTITLKGTNDKAVIGEVINESAIEDLHTVAKGELEVSDKDDNQAHFQAHRYNGKFGHLNLHSDGTWSYHLHNHNHAVQSMAEGEIKQDVISVKSADGTIHKLTIDIHGVNDKPTLNNIAHKVINEDSKIAGDVTMHDIDTNDTHTFSIKHSIDGLSIDSKSGHWNFDAANQAYQHLQVGQTTDVKATIIVEDNHGSKAEKTLFITLHGQNDAPKVGDVHLVTKEDKAIHFTNKELLGNTIDPENDKLVVSNLHVDPKYGKIIDHGMEHYEFRPAKDYNGKDVPITFDVSDGRITSHGTLKMDVTPVNDAPVAHNIHIQTYEDIPRTFSAAELLKHATDIDSPHGSLQISNVRLPHGNPGTIVNNHDGTYTYTPKHNWNHNHIGGGNQDIIFNVIDDKGSISKDAYVKIDVIPVQDRAQIQPDGTTSQDLNVKEDDKGNFSAQGKLSIYDPDKGDEVFQATSSISGRYGNFSIDSHGKWHYIINNAIAAVQELQEGQKVIDTIQVHSKDGTVYTLAIEVEGTNDRPMISKLGSMSVKEDDGLVAGEIKAHDVDSGDPITYTLKTPIDGLYLDPASGQYTFDPKDQAYQSLKEGEIKTVTADVIVHDSHGASDMKQLIIQIEGKNDIPVVKDTHFGHTNEDTAITFHANDIISKVATDLDGDALSISNIKLSDPTLGTITQDGKGGYTYRPAKDFHGKDIEFTYSITDGKVTVDGKAHLDVLPVNDAPVVHNFHLGDSLHSTIVFNENEFLKHATDVDGDTLSIKDVSVDSKYGNLVGPDKNGDYFLHTIGGAGQSAVHIPIHFTVTDGQADRTATATLTHHIGHNTNDHIKELVIPPHAVEDKNQIAYGELQVVDAKGNPYKDASGNYIEGFKNEVIHGKYGDLFIKSSGVYNYVLDSTKSQVLKEAEHVKEEFSVQSTHGSHKLTIHVDGTGDTPIITPSSTVVQTQAKEDSLLSATGKLDITDPDRGESAFKPDNYISTTHGHLQIEADGRWTYHLNNSNPKIQELSEGETLVDKVTVESVDGTKHEISVTVNGSNDKPVITNIATQATHEGASILKGQVLAHDIDTKDTLTFTTTKQTIGFTLHSDGSYEFDPSNKAYDGLKAHQTKTIDIPITVNDAHGGTDTKTLSISITGSNNAPTADATVVLPDITEDKAKIFDEQSLVSLAHGKDLDGDQLHIQNIHLDPKIGTISDDGKGHFTFNPVPNLHQDNVPVSFDITDGQKSVTVRATLNIIGVNDIPTVSNFHFSAINEDTHKDFTTQDLLNHTKDVDIATDGDVVSLQGIPTVDAKYGQIIDKGNGHWQFVPKADYHANNIPISFTVQDKAGATATGHAYINVNSVKDPAVISDVKTDHAQEDLKLTAEGKVDVKDADGPHEEKMQPSSYMAGHFGHLEIDAAGNWKYSLDKNQNVQHLAHGELFSEHFTTHSVDGTAHTINVDIQGTNDVGSITGTASAKILENTQSVTGRLKVHDIDTSEAHLVPGDMKGTYGHLEVMSNGQWVYHLDQNTKMEALAEGEMHVERFTVKTPEGISQDIVVTVEGKNDAPTIAAHAVLTHSNEDTTVTISEHDLLQNATDIDAGDILSVQNITAEHGTITSDGKGTYSYTPDANFNGTETFHYDIQDRQGASIHATITKEIDPVFDEGTVTVHSVTSDNIINIAESGGDVSISGMATGGDISTGDKVTLQINGHDYITTVDANGKFDVQVSGADLVQQPTFNAVVTSHDSTVTGTSQVSHTVSVDITPPTAAITVDNITSDNIINAAETGVSINVTGSVSGDVKDGDQVNLHVNNKDHSGAVNSGQYSIAVDGTDLKADSSIQASVSTTDTAGNTQTVTKTHSYEVDTQAFAKDDTFTTDEDRASISGNVLANDEKGATVTTVGDFQGQYGVYHLQSNGSFTYTLDTVKAQHMQKGDSEQDSISYTIKDSAGNSTTATLTTTINGTNDNPVVNSSSVTSGKVVEDAQVSSILGHLDISDIDSGDTHSIIVDTPAKYGHFSLQGDIWQYSLDNNNQTVNNLYSGQSLQDNIVVKIEDGHGGFTQQSITVDIEGHSILAPALNATTATQQIQADNIDQIDNDQQAVIDEEQTDTQDKQVDSEISDLSSLISPDRDTAMPNLDNVVEHLESQKAPSITLGDEKQDALATVATLLDNTQSESKEAEIIKTVENQEPKEHHLNPNAIDQTTHIDDKDSEVSSDSSSTLINSEHTDYVVDSHNQVNDDQDLNDGTGITG